MPVKNKFKVRTIGRFFKYTLFAINIIAIVLLLLSVSAWLIVPSRVTFVAYLGLAFPIILGINVAFLILWLVFWRWKYALVQLIVILCCWNPISTYFPIHRQTKIEEIPDDVFKVLTYNVRGFNWLRGDSARVNPIIDYIVNSDADIVCLQEFVVSSNNKDKKGLITRAEFNKRMKAYPYRSIIRLGDKNNSNLYGLACYSKYPIDNAAAIPISSPYNGSAIYQIRKGKRIINLINNHLESNRITAEDKVLYKKFIEAKEKQKMIDEVTQNIQARLGAAYRVREEQANIISAYIQRQDSVSDATIVCGDFNDAPNSFAYHKIKGDLIDSYASTGFGPGITYHENQFWFRIDFILHSIGLESYNCTVGKVKYSDHYPVWTYLRFK